MTETHTYIIGKTGTGKSTFLQNEILENKGGFCLLDPHGDLAERIADTIDVIYFDPTTLPLGFNVLANVPVGQRHLVAQNVTSSFKAIWQDSWGPRLEWILYNSLRLLLDNNGSVIDIPKLLTNQSFRLKCLSKSSYRAFWDDEFEQWDNRYRNDAIAPVLNKIGQLVADPILSRIFRGKTTLKPAKIMNQGQRLVVNLAKGKLGETASHLLGALITSAFMSAAQARADISENERKPFTLYVDEFQNFATDSFSSILSEARKWKLRLILSHQFLGQVPELLRKAVFGNVSTFISFRVGAEDAPLVASELGITNPEVLTDLPPHRAYRRIGGPYNAELFDTDPPPLTNGRLQAVRNHTRACYVC